MSEGDIPLMRVPISVPCTVPVVPGSMDATAPIAERTEKCARDAWWVIGRAPICHDHLIEAVGEPAVRATFPAYRGPNQIESLPVEKRHRYPQTEAVMLGEE